jgi:hypothetical protein
MHVTEPRQAPPHALKLKLVPGVSLSVTWVPAAKVAVHPVAEAFEQLIPVGMLVTVPVPVMETVNASAGAVKAAVTLAPVVTVTLQVVVPLQAPVQPANVSPVPGVSMRLT